MTEFAKEILPVNLEDEMQQSYLDYAMSVIVGRALPDVRDGLKPVHRRVLFAMGELNNDWNKPYKKSARVVGDVIGKYHPHGDTAVYDTIVRMAQPFSLRYMLVDGQGNFGSVDGDAPAAMRYTEVRMARIAHSLIDDLDKETVDFIPNYDGSEQEPVVFPTRVPNLLVNGSAGIAVGMATNIPPHNLAEVVNACIALIEDPDAYADTMRTFGLPETSIEHMLEFGSSILIQPVRSQAADEALQGRSGTGVITDYSGERILASWAPLDIPDFRWAIIGKMDVDEAFAPMRKLARDTLIQTALIMLGITLVVMFLAGSFVRPVNELIQRVRQAGSGDEDVQIDTGGKDEIGELAVSFKELVESVRHQTRQLKDMNAENERLLESVLPESVARRLRSGEKEIADKVPDVSILFARLVGFTEYCDTVPADTSVAVLNELVSAFDDEASVARCMELGATDHLPKSFDSEALTSRVEACLGRRTRSGEGT